MTKMQNITILYFQIWLSFGQIIKANGLYDRAISLLQYRKMIQSV